MRRSATLLVVAVLGAAMGQEYIGHALFVRTSDDDVEPAHSRVQRAAPASSADVMAQNILEWIQGIYRQGARKIRQQSDSNVYLPPYSTQRPPEKPRPFQPASTSQDSVYSSLAQNEVTNYPYQRPSSQYIPPNIDYSSADDVSSQSQTPNSLYASPSSLRPSSTYLPIEGFGTSPSYGSRPTAQPTFSSSPSSVYSSTGTSLGGSSTYLPPSNAAIGFSTSNARPPSPFVSGQTSSGNFGASSASTTYLPPRYNNFPTTNPSSPRPPVTALPPKISSPSSYPPSDGYPSRTDGFSTTYLPPRTSSFPSSRQPSGTFPTGSSTTGGYPPSSGYPTPGYPSPGTGSVRPTFSTEGYQYPGPTTPSTTGQTEEHTGTGSTSVTTGTGTGPVEGGTGTGSTTTGEADDDLKHPPHIHNISVECSKTMMTINIEFNRAFDGVIYSKGFFMNPDCRYVEQNSGKTEYSFTVSLDSCGTQFINDFEGEAGQAYLENVLVLQNEPGIQEVWDTVRRVRCLWEGNINKALSVNLSVDMLNQEIVTFSGDTATAKLDIQIGKGPFAPVADGLVKIGETMTLVVSVEGDPAFDLQVRDCVARDESSTNVLQLTDERGCILKPKLFGAFQKTNDTGNTGASIIAYAFFQAFKFPDVMDLFIECNVELCKTDCEPCPEAGQQIEPGRRRRSVSYAPPSNTTSAVLLSDPVRVGRGLKVILLDDLSTATNQIMESLEQMAVDEMTKDQNICLSNNGFYVAFSLMISTLIVTTVTAITLYIKLQRIYRTKFLQT